MGTYLFMIMAASGFLLGKTVAQNPHKFRGILFISLCLAVSTIAGVALGLLYQDGGGGDVIVPMLLNEVLF
jgi:hypothetical protein